MIAEIVATKIIAGVSQYRVNVIGIVSSLVELDQELWAVQSVIVRPPGFQIPGPGEMDAIDPGLLNEASMWHRHRGAGVIQINVDQLRRSVTL